VNRERRGVRSRRRRGVLAALALISLAVVVLATVALRQMSPGGRPGAAVVVSIPPGSSTARIGSLLARAGIVHDGTLFALYARAEESGPLLAGTYRLRTNEAYGPVLSDLEAGTHLAVDTLSVPPGLTLRQIAARVAALPGMHLSAAAFLAAAHDGQVRSPLEPAGTDDLEGLVYPATYDVSPKETVVQILADLVDTFDRHVMSAGLLSAAAAAHQTPYQVITVASIVQAEAKFAAQYPDVASVLDNRLAAGMPLGADSTLIYALRRTDPGLDPADVDYEQPSRYNTRLHTGLPPTPIGTPSMAAIEAAAHPPATSLLYFVEVDPDGELGFASTGAGFRRLEARCAAAGLGC